MIETMISEKVNRYCNCDISKIENYYEAISDKENMWHCHHRLEICSNGEIISHKDLIKQGLYYNRPASELVFMLASEHNKLHNICGRNPFYGKHHTDEAKRKISESGRGKKLSDEQKKMISELQKGNKNWLGKHHNEVTRKKISESLMGRHLSEETKRKISRFNKGKKLSVEDRLKKSFAMKSYWAKKKMSKEL